MKFPRPALNIARIIGVIAAPMVLAACSDEPEVVAEDDGREASGEVLEGSISDAMLPLDQVRSQPPLREAEPTGSGTAAATAAGEGEEAAEPAAAEPAEDAPEPADE